MHTGRPLKPKAQQLNVLPTATQVTSVLHNDVDEWVNLEHLLPIISYLCDERKSREMSGIGNQVISILSSLIKVKHIDGQPCDSQLSLIR